MTDKEFPEEYRNAIGGKDEILSLKASNEVYFRELKIAEDKVEKLRCEIKSLMP